MIKPLLKANVPGMFEGTYITTSTVISPAVKYSSYKDRRYAELRGFWDVKGDFMGGPFSTVSNGTGQKGLSPVRAIRAGRTTKNASIYGLRSLIVET